MRPSFRCFMCGSDRPDLKAGYLTESEGWLTPVHVCVRCADAACAEGRAEHEIVKGSLAVIIHRTEEMV